MEGVFISWNVENWVTVLLMATLGYLIFALAVQGLKQFSASQTGS